ncbi:hypothetical protein CONCODRAFT_12415 [Conidiobolus coronatus NRRL 28638]|uniref:MoaF-like domain-containing protein n=1 Tax=Conidiobolus coronatus (strain ATCC 28846 / CBS 209.66 / NRRL 28638) TaxID=796925 RepID=A0A137NT66_CONC2|nr:hypothetical protein CONCODRAFT_12415 [Conidiobolus coronatus NRRL 28638]|eukprot:KXN65874.1 hypothetical protein CONCODRAFT_12415 [Conidiobolus coronatus NRRL 28638]
MKSLSTFLIAAAFNLSSLVSAYKATNPLIGKTLHLSYPEQGLEFTNTYINATHINWKRLKSPENGPMITGTEAYSFRQIANGFYMIMWNELEGVDVVQIIDKNVETLFAHVTYADDQNSGNRRAMSNMEGLITNVTNNYNYNYNYNYY